MSSLIEEVKRISYNVSNIDFLIDSYFEWKDERGDLKKYVEQRIKKLDKDRVKDSVSNK